MSKPFVRIEGLKLNWEIDESPDISYLETTPEEHYGKDGSNWAHVTEEGKENVIKEHGSIWNACVAYAEQDKKRLEAFDKGEWNMLGITAKITLNVPINDRHILRAITSGGLWGIESDSDKNYLKELENEQVEELMDILKALSAKATELENWLKERSRNG